MKKIVLLTTALVVTLAMLCAGALALEPGDVLGAWYLNGMEAEGFSVSPSALGMDITLVLNEDNTAAMQMPGQEDAAGTWAIADGQLVVTVDGDGLALSLVDGDLVAEEDGMKMIFGKEKVDAEPVEASPARTDAALADFNGTWNAHLAVIEGMELPIDALGLEFGLVIEDGKATLSAFGVSDSMEGDVSGGVLTVSADGETTMTFTLHEDGTVSCVLEDAFTIIFQRAGE